jgi:Spherulation-specific family 4
MTRYLALALFLCLGLGSARAAITPQVGVISYWGTDMALYDQIPEDAVALINPDNGIFVSSGQTQTLVPNLKAFQDIVTRQAQRDVRMLGYVPTGYFNHGCDVSGRCQTLTRIEAQIRAYFDAMPDLEGIFFDEATPGPWDCSAFAAEYQTLRDLVRKIEPRALIAFNAGVPDNCAVAGAKAGDILVLFENSLAEYTAQSVSVRASTLAALQKGVIPWHLIHSVPTATDVNTVFAQAQAAGTQFLYATSIGGNWQAGDNTWGSLPPYWPQELALFQAAADQPPPSCVALTAQPEGQTLARVKSRDIGQHGHVYIGTRTPSGARWFFDGLRWNEDRGNGRSVLMSQTLGGVLRLPNAALGNMVSTLPPKASTIGMAYARADDPERLKARQAVCWVNRH